MSKQTDEIKIILLGNSGVGKTSLINTVTGREFSVDEKTTEGASFNCQGENTPINSKHKQQGRKGQT